MVDHRGTRNAAERIKDGSESCGRGLGFAEDSFALLPALDSEDVGGPKVGDGGRGCREVRMVGAAGSGTPVVEAVFHPSLPRALLGRHLGRPRLHIHGPLLAVGAAGGRANGRWERGVVGGGVGAAMSECFSMG